VSEEGIVARDEAVFETALSRFGVPIILVLSGGYTKASTPCIARSLENLMRRFNLVEKAEICD